jgi:hypothetical protein
VYQAECAFDLDGGMDLRLRWRATATLDAFQQEADGSGTRH